jgi:hypothetical protein
MSILSIVTTNEPVRAASPYVINSGGGGSTDGIPDTWWSTYFPGDTASWVAVNDPDLDGQTNGAEYAAGTDPTSAASVFAILAFSRVGSNVAVTWSAVAGKAYAVQTTGSLAGTNWQTSGSVITNFAGLTNLSTNVSLPDPDGFLRIRLAP